MDKIYMIVKIYDNSKYYKEEVVKVFYEKEKAENFLKKLELKRKSLKKEKEKLSEHFNSGKCKKDIFECDKCSRYLTVDYLLEDWVSSKIKEFEVE